MYIYMYIYIYLTRGSHLTAHEPKHKNMRRSNILVCLKVPLAATNEPLWVNSLRSGS